MAKLSKKVKIRTQRETLLIGIPTAMRQLMEITGDSSVMVTYEDGKMIIETIKEHKEHKD